jgi:hypothetical protein
VLTGRGKRWVRHEMGSDSSEAADEGQAERHALWWPPTKVAGRYLAPYLQALEEAPADARSAPSGQPVDLDLEREIASAADALRVARRREETA